MISEKMNAALNEQVTKEMYSAYLYMAMSSYSNSIGLKGFANWFMVQYHEEMFHAMKIYEYIHSQSGDVALKTIDEPPAWKSPSAKKTTPPEFSSSGMLPNRLKKRKTTMISSTSSN